MTVLLKDDTRLSDLTVGEFKALFREIVEDVVAQAVFELQQELPDPDGDRPMKPAFIAKLQLALDESGERYTLDDLKRKLDE